MTRLDNNTHALLFGLSDDLAGELTVPLKSCAIKVQAMKRGDLGIDARRVSESPANIIFCGPDVNLVTELRSAKPGASVVVVTRHPEFTGWLDSIEAGAADYCAAPFETSQVKWIVESSLRSGSTACAAA